MEDRGAQELVLELLDGDEAAVRARVASAGVAHALVFRNLRPDETRFPNTVGSFGYVAIYETGDVPDLPPEDVTVHRRLGFRRYPRPSQGRLTSRTTGIYLILISPTSPERAQELRDWGDFVHLHHIAAASPDGFTTITAYENATEDGPKYMHLYELDADDPVKATDAMPTAVMQRWGFEMGDPEFVRWAICDALSIDYVNVFGRVDD